MANFKTHLSVAVVASTITAFTVPIGSSIIFAPFLILSGTIGGLLPDLDSDNSTPVKMLFLLFSVVTAFTIFSLYFEEDIVQALLYASVGLIAVNFIMKPIFLKITSHRGVFHSIPMGILFGIGVYYLLHLKLNYDESLYIGLFLSGGYIVHLALDEFYSVDLMGGRVKRSFGSALKLFSSKQIFLYIVMYIAIGILLADILK